MNFDLSEEQKMLRDAAQKFLRAEYRFDARNKIVASEPGMSRELWQRFGEFGWLSVALPEADAGFGGAAKSYQLEAQIRRAGGIVRISTRLISLNGGDSIWSERYDDNSDDLFGLQDRVALSVAANIEAAIRRGPTWSPSWMSTHSWCCRSPC